jgi:hypothetical protein
MRVMSGRGTSPTVLFIPPMTPKLGCLVLRPGITPKRRPLLAFAGRWKPCGACRFNVIAHQLCKVATQRLDIGTVSLLVCIATDIRTQTLHLYSIAHCHQINVLKSCTISDTATLRFLMGTYMVRFKTAPISPLSMVRNMDLVRHK